MDNNKKRKLIKKIMADSNLTEKEKNKKIQEIFSSEHINKIENKLNESNESKTCSHYEKKCYKFKFSCCKVVDPCKRCHIDRDKCNHNDIKILYITCINCGLEQNPSKICSNSKCSTIFSNSYCKICQIWTNKEIYHCEECGICRVGTKDTLFHCINCGICFNKNIEQTHQCIDNNNLKNKRKNNIKKWSEGLCVVCNESTFNSQSNSVILPCSHFIHQSCFDKYVQQSNYKCPYCKKSICNLTTQWNFIRYQIKQNPLPNDMIPIELNDIVDTKFGKFKILCIKIINEKKIFEGIFINWFCDKYSKINVKGILNNTLIKKNIYKNIYCNDCETNSLTEYHFYGLECKLCGSFNTQE